MLKYDIQSLSCFERSCLSCLQTRKIEIAENVNQGIKNVSWSLFLNVIRIALHVKLHQRIAHLVILTKYSTQLNSNRNAITIFSHILKIQMTFALIYKLRSSYYLFHISSIFFLNKI
ncbi:unnamed protein product [Paramecium octaurelia]|uniref:Uncharacterized protein n=1 Tax=Paramecium octaurelia TaxID=43137 RepID=A0A8S1YLN8_PAROT|nr:unnamed protein product [Paramecium octaurelia]